MLRSKRQRSGEIVASDDDMTRLNPSLMTERQQLAFLLRKTAPASDSSALSSDSSEDELTHRFAGGERRIQRQAPSGSQASSAVDGDGADGKADAVSRYRGRSRESRPSVKKPRRDAALNKTRKVAASEAARENEAFVGNGQHRSKSEKGGTENQDTRPPPSKVLNVMAAPSAAKASHSSSSVGQHAKKNSPSSSSDVLHMETFESDGSVRASDCWSPHCALCCASDGSRPARVAFSEALFLCPSCDRKYPTQRALGRV